MTVIDTPSSDQATTASYRDAVDVSSTDDRAFATEVSGKIVEVLKAFNAIKGRLHGSGATEGFDFALLVKLTKSGPMRASDLAEQLCSDPSTVSRQVAGMVKSGLLERKADPADGRASILVLTTAGHDRVEEMGRRRGELFAPIIAHWSPGDRAVFSRLLGEFAHGLTHNLESVKNVASDMIQHGAQEKTSQGSNA